jgi:hypothetical protein
VSLEWLSVERLVAAAAVGQLAVLVIAARYARSQVDEARELRKEQARPFVVVDFEPEQSPFVNLVVANLGKTMARNVRLEIDPPLASTLDSVAPVPLAKLKLFTEGIPSLAPGKRWVTLFDTMTDRKSSDLPNSYEVRLTYEWDGGKPVTDLQRLDLDLYRYRLSVTRHTIHDVNKTLDKIRRQLDKWTAGSGGGLLVVSPDDKRRRDEDFRAWVEEQRATEHAADDGQAAGNGKAPLTGRLRELVGRLRHRR